VEEEIKNAIEASLPAVDGAARANGLVYDRMMLKEMKSFFTYSGPAKPQRVNEVEIDLNKKIRHVFTYQTLAAVVVLRFGFNVNVNEPKMSFIKIGRQLGIKPQSAHAIVKRFLKNGNRIVMGRSYNGAGSEKITYDIGSFLRSGDCLARWAGLTLKQRCDKLFHEKGLRIHATTLWNYYQKHDIKFRTTQYKYRFIADDAWQRTKLDFCYRLGALMLEYKPIVYVDETSVNSWYYRNRTFRASKNDSTRIRMPKVKYSGTTIYGAMGYCLERGTCFHIAQSTNTTDFCTFLGNVRLKA